MLFPAPRRERLELARAGGAQRLPQIVRDLERLDAVEERPRPIALRGGDLRESGRLHASFFEEAVDPHLVRSGPSAARLAWGEQQRGALVIERLDHAVD